MHPSTIFPFIHVPVSTYNLILLGFIIAACPLTVVLNRRVGVEPEVTVNLYVVTVPIALAGSRILDLAEYWGAYGGSLAAALPLAGSSIYGALLATLVVVPVYALWRGVPVSKILDGGAPVMAIGEAITRVACFLNGCCYGIPGGGRFAVTFPPESFAYRDQVARGLLRPGALHSLPVVPVQLMSASVAFIAFVALLRIVLRPHRDGGVFYAFLVFYGALRLGMAPLREEALRSMIVFSIAFLTVGMLGLLYGRRDALAPLKSTRPVSPAR